jgi:hypothetical protein
MLYEPWIESASSYQELKERLKIRGYSDLPMGATPLLDLTNYIKAPMADCSSVKVRRTMIRKLEE